MIQVYVKVKNAYGVRRYYPDCPISEIFADLLEAKTLSYTDFRAMLKLGYEINIRSETGSSFVWEAV
jgi:hypothetical protein